MTEKIYASLKLTNHKVPRGTNVLKTHILEPFLMYWCHYVIMTGKIYVSLKLTNHKPPRGTNVLMTHILEPCLKV